MEVEGIIRAIDFSADGDRMVVGYDVSGRGQVAVYRANFRNRAPTEMPGLQAPIGFVGFAAGGEMVVAADVKGTLVVWATDDQRELFRIDLTRRAGGEGARVRAMANPGGPYVGWLAVAKGASEGIVEVAQIPSGQVVTSISKVPLAPARWSREGGHLLIGGTVWNWDTLRRWQPKVAGVSATAVGGTRAVHTSPASCDGFLTIADLATAKVMRSIPIGRTACPRWVWFSARDRGLVWVGPGPDGDDGLGVYSWDERRDRQRRLSKLEMQPTVVAIDADRNLLAVSDGQVVQYIRLR